MKVLVTGADGMLGSNIVRLLLMKKYTVSVFIDPKSRSQTLSDLEIRKFYGCLLNRDSIAQAMDGQDIVIHAAAMTNVWPDRSSIVRRVEEVYVLIADAIR